MMTFTGIGQILKNNVAFITTLIALCSCTSPKDKLFQKEMEEQNRLFPMMIDENTRIDSIRYDENENTFRYYYTLSGESDHMISDWDRKVFTDNMLKEIKTAPGMNLHREHKVIMEYIYFSEKATKELFKITITPDMYNK